MERPGEVEGDQSLGAGRKGRWDASEVEMNAVSRSAADLRGWECKGFKLGLGLEGKMGEVVRR
jgi:hypothetical protein